MPYIQEGSFQSDTKLEVRCLFMLAIHCSNVEVLILHHVASSFGHLLLKFEKGYTKQGYFIMAKRKIAFSEGCDRLVCPVGARFC